MPIHLLISRTLRWGVSLACIVTAIGGILYLVHHGSEPLSLDALRQFSYTAEHATTYTTIGGILHGFITFSPIGWIQMGVVLLILTPIVRVLLSLVDFLQERDWLYATISAIVLGVIIANSIGGFK